MNAPGEWLKIRLPKETVRKLREEAKLRNTTIARLVRESIELFLVHDRGVRMQAAEALFQIEAPIADWPVMEDEIERAHIEQDG